MLGFGGKKHDYKAVELSDDDDDDGQSIDSRDGLIGGHSKPTNQVHWL